VESKSPLRGIVTVTRLPKPTDPENVVWMASRANEVYLLYTDFQKEMDALPVRLWKIWCKRFVSDIEREMFALLRVPGTMNVLNVLRTVSDELEKTTGHERERELRNERPRQGKVRQIIIDASFSRVFVC